MQQKILEKPDSTAEEKTAAKQKIKDKSKRIIKRNRCACRISSNYFIRRII